MFSTVSVVLVLGSAHFAAARTITSLGLPRGADCEVKGIKGVCKLSDDCNADEQFSEGSRVICSVVGRTPIVCCTSSREPRAIGPGSKANAFCQVNLKKCNLTDPDLAMRIDVRPAIAGGRESLAAEHPHMALIGYGASKEWMCGGTLISERYIVSAGHCSSQTQFGEAAWVRLGDLDYSTDTDDAEVQELKIVQIIVHPEFKEPAMYNDIALFKLEKDVVFTDSVRPVCLYTSTKVPYKTVTATGWGRTGFVEDVSPQLRAVDLSMVNDSRCNILRKSNPRVPTGIKSVSMLCAGEEEGIRDTCQGDSGGPIVIQVGTRCLKTQVGVTSFGGICGEPNSPGVYTRVSYFIPWIESIVWP